MNLHENYKNSMNPTPEDLAMRLIDAAGYHDSPSIPTSKVIELLVAFQGYEVRENNQLRNMLLDFQSTTVLPLIVSRDARDAWLHGSWDTSTAHTAQSSATSRSADPSPTSENQ